MMGHFMTSDFMMLEIIPTPPKKFPHLQEIPTPPRNSHTSIKFPQIDFIMIDFMTGDFMMRDFIMPDFIMLEIIPTPPTNSQHKNYLKEKL